MASPSWSQLANSFFHVSAGIVFVALADLYKEDPLPFSRTNQLNTRGKHIEDFLDYVVAMKISKCH